MPQAKLISPITKQGLQKKRVAAYCRVSTNLDDQKTSYATQIRVYQKMINDNPEWTLVDIFADEGISGTQAENRPEFQRMIKMCERREIDLILVKSMSRFARNVKETLEYVRKLRHLGVGINFEKEGINTLSMGDEMLLNTFSAIAQEESQAISQHLRLSITKRMEFGEYVDSNAPYGFRLVDKKLEIYEQEAAIVKLIYHLYLSGCSTSEIARELTAKEIPTKGGKDQWRSTKVAYILTNERYVGDCKYQKTCRSTTVPFKQMKNRGEEDMFYASDTHEGFIDRETFDKVQELYEKRQSQFSKAGIGMNVYPLTSKIRCAECGAYFRRKVRSGQVKWLCSKHNEDKSACRSFYYSEERIYDGFLSMVNKLRFGEEQILHQVILKLEMASMLHKKNNQTAKQISEGIAELNAKLLMLDSLHSKGYLTADVYQSQARDIKKKLSEMKVERQDSFDSRIVEMSAEVRRLESIILEIEEPLEDFNEKLFKEIVVGMTINNKDELTITLLGGLEFTELI